MILSIFNKTKKLSQSQSEILKVALLDSLRFAHTEILDHEQGTLEHNFLSNKIVLLDDILKELDLTYE